jgi:hypothetical protein
LAISFLRNLCQDLCLCAEHGEMNITSFFGQDKMTAFDVIDLPTSSFKGSNVFVSADSRKPLHKWTL